MSGGGILEDRLRSLSTEGGRPVLEAAQWGGGGDDGRVDRPLSAHVPDPHPIGLRPHSADHPPLDAARQRGADFSCEGVVPWPVDASVLVAQPTPPAA
eukprot:2669514-Pyramimonas_sp.AAC.1